MVVLCQNDTDVHNSVPHLAVRCPSVQLMKFSFGDVRTTGAPMIRTAGLILGLALLGLPTSAATAADRDVTVSNRVASERVVVKRRIYRGRYYGCPDGYGCYAL